mgnify:CR=1 FL=1
MAKKGEIVFDGKNLLTLKRGELRQYQGKDIAMIFLLLYNAIIKSIMIGELEVKKALAIIPRGTRVRCYGYYTDYNGVRWLYIQVALDRVLYTGFSSSKYLER